MTIAEDLTAYLSTQTDFDLEMFAYRTLVGAGIYAVHGATYADPVEQKPRQFDVRALVECRKDWFLSLAVECKSISKDFPLLVCRVPRPAEDAFHEVVVSGGVDAEETMRVDDGLRLYPHLEPVGKKLVQVKREAVAGQVIGIKNGQELLEPKDRFKTTDAEIYNKWAQALASADGLVKRAGRRARNQAQRVAYTLILPIVVVEDQTLWVADYSGEGNLVEGPNPANETTVFVGKPYEFGGSLNRTYRLTHLHIFTRTGFQGFVNAVSRQGVTDIHHRMFGFLER